MEHEIFQTITELEIYSTYLARIQLVLMDTYNHLKKKLSDNTFNIFVQENNEDDFVRNFFNRNANTINTDLPNIIMNRHHHATIVFFLNDNPIHKIKMNIGYNGIEKNMYASLYYYVEENTFGLISKELWKFDPHPLHNNISKNKYRSNLL